jgi:hypothetical protein
MIWQICLRVAFGAASKQKRKPAHRSNSTLHLIALSPFKGSDFSISGL